MGWNYNKIMATPKSDGGGAVPVAAAAAPTSTAVAPKREAGAVAPATSSPATANPLGGYKLQKNMSLSQLDERIRQNVSREELYNLICNNEQKPAPKAGRVADGGVGQPMRSMAGGEPSAKLYNIGPTKPLNQLGGQPAKLQQWSHGQAAQPAADQPKLNDLSATRHPLTKSVSQISMPTMFNNLTRKKSPKKTTIPTLFKPLYKSTSNTHVFSRNYEVPDEPAETFTPKHLTKSSSSSSIFCTPSAMYFNTIRLANNEHKKLNQMAPAAAATGRIEASDNNNNNNNATANSIRNKNAELFQAQRASGKHSGGGHMTATPLYRPDANPFFVKQNVPQLTKATVNYAPLKSKSSMHIPFYGNFPTSLGSTAGSATANKPTNKSHR